MPEWLSVPIGSLVGRAVAWQTGGLIAAYGEYSVDWLSFGRTNDRLIHHRRDMDDNEEQRLIVGEVVPSSRGPDSLPVLIRDAGGAARFAYEEFFHGQIRNPYTRKAYLHSIRRFSEWCVAGGLELIRVTPADVGRFLDSLSVALPTKKLHLAALRRFFDRSSCGIS